ncbi:NAD(P)H-hydrate dehydratase [Solitalea koreensis]|uniref:Bifunctional NAD(P)H-hydrate repair enzyme n=1 Tax=Solitalea koreensis TaxID=543615 RepID=A0A521BYX3_9SPHI|nr:NAD(P)H-hydrate dehydratase [Solitalea koreensis]SMO52373.1 NAD(P)H-hydrate epimerase [Solitalea koreensis]
MLKLLSASQIRSADAHTIQHESIGSLDLMERASNAFVQKFVAFALDRQTNISIYCGTGNNGGDGLAIARILFKNGYKNVSVKILHFSFKTTSDFDENLRRLAKTNISAEIFNEESEFPEEHSPILIDAILGSGLNKPLEGGYARWITHLNNLSKKVIAVDVPTGFFCDAPLDKNAIVFHADHVISFQRPKLNFLLPESAQFIKEFHVVDIGLDEHFIQAQDSNKVWVEENDIKAILKPRASFSHKGTFGHALIIAGQTETMGAALLSSEACLHAGAGLTTAFIPEPGLSALNARSPEVMAILGDLQKIEWNKFDALGIGPGFGVQVSSLEVLRKCLTHYRGPAVYDADALNMLAANKELFNLLPENSIVCPHVKEFDRLFGAHKNWQQRIETMERESTERGLIIILKNRYSIITAPSGVIYFNPTGNPAMASGGSGDVLTGILTALLAQGYSALQTTIAGVYIHGKAADELVQERKMFTVPARYLIKQLPITMGKLINSFA